MLSKKEKQLSTLIFSLHRRHQKQDKALIALSHLILAEHDFNLALSKSNLALFEIITVKNTESKELLEAQYLKWQEKQDKIFDEQKKIYNLILSQFFYDKTEPIEQIKTYAKSSPLFTI